jgi:hypothetical protein
LSLPTLIFVIEEISMARSNHLDKENLEDLIDFIKEYIHQFKIEANGISHIKSFHMELMRMINYLARFGLLIYRNNKFQKEDMCSIFGFLCCICSLFTSRSYLKSMHSLEKLISKDTILTDVSKMNPVQKAAYDIKYTLFNKNFTNTSFRMGEFEDYEDKSSSTHFHIKLLTEVVIMFHLFLDLRQHYLMANNVEFFYNSVFKRNSDSLGDKEVAQKEIDEFNETLVKEFIHLIPDSEEFHQNLIYNLPSIDQMFDYTEANKMHRSSLEENDTSEMHDEFAGLMIDTFNMHSYDPFFRQQIMLLISRYHSERAEFLRNLDRSLLFFDKSDWEFYGWTQSKIEQFMLKSEKAYIWLLELKQMKKEGDNYIRPFTLLDDIKALLNILEELKKAIVYN